MAQWLPTYIAATGGRYYQYSEWYMLSQYAAYVSVGYHDAANVEHWVSIFAAIPSSADWKQFSSGLFLPADAKDIQFFHALNGVGFLQLDDFSVTEADAPPGFDQGMVSLTFDDGSHRGSTTTPGLYYAGRRILVYAVHAIVGSGQDSA